MRKLIKAGRLRAGTSRYLFGTGHLRWIAVVVVLASTSDADADGGNGKFARWEAPDIVTVAAPQVATIDAAIQYDHLCVFNAQPFGGVDHGNLIVYNFGTSTLFFTAVGTPSGSWLTVPSGPDFQLEPYPAPPLTIPFTMDATGLSEGIYHGLITMEHNAPGTPNPLLVHVELRVDADYMCADTVNLRTAVASPGVLALTVGSNGRHGFGMGSASGLYRDADGSVSMFDASLIVAHGPQTSDTTVYYGIYAGSGYGDNGARGFIAKTPLTVDSSAYGTGSGNATASYTMRTKDEVLAINVEWFFPQHADSSEFILAKYTVENISASTVTDILVGQLNDFDVTPGTLFESYQESVRNHANYVAADNLIYQYGATKSGVTPNPPLGLAERYSAGIAYLAGRDYAGGGMQFANSQVSLRGGTEHLDVFQPTYFSDSASNFLYEEFEGPLGVTIVGGNPDADSASDLYTYLCLDRGLSLAPGATQTYVVGFVSDTLDNPGVPSKSAATTGLLETVARAKAWAVNHNIIGGSSCVCANQGDIEPDGFLTALDLAACIDVLFAGSPDVQDAECPSPRFDIDCDGFSTSLDLSKLIDHLFAGGDGPCDPCAP